MALGSANCTAVPDAALTDAGVAGAGVLLSFIITNFISLALAGSITFCELTLHRPTHILRKLLLSFSDQQIITGIGIQSVGLAKMSTMVPYHFFIIWMLSCLSTVTHSSTLLALVNDFRRDWVLRWLRQFLMFVNLGLSVTMGVFVLYGSVRNVPETLPIACVWDEEAERLGRESGVSTANAPLSVAGTIVVIVAQVLIFALSVWYLHLRARKWVKIVQVIAVCLLLAIGVGATVRVVMVSQAFGTPSVPLVGNSESEWSFGQLLSMLLLLLPILSALEIFRGEIRVKSPMMEENTGRMELNDFKSNGHDFEPNPLWGSRTRLAGGGA